MIPGDSFKFNEYFHEKRKQKDNAENKYESSVYQKYSG